MLLFKEKNDVPKCVYCYVEESTFEIYGHVDHRHTTSMEFLDLESARLYLKEMVEVITCREKKYEWESGEYIPIINKPDHVVLYSAYAFGVEVHYFCITKNELHQ